MPNSDNAAKVTATLASIPQAIDTQCKLALRYLRHVCRDNGSRS